MPEITMQTAIQQIFALLSECFEGPQGQGSWFLDNDPKAGWFGTLENVSAEQASRVIGGSTIAAHAHHMLFSLEASAAWIRQERTPRKWSESWKTQTVDEAAWSALREQMRRRYRELREAIAGHAAGEEESMGGAIGALAHAAYHLGAIRQKLVCMRDL
ncbi:MAG: hypothetical protein QUU85_06330 [Candidatus Eisenbacteria bacterium]|nr:hypothetical protein [Candidatus Eisenbacteria bacterium]